MKTNIVSDSAKAINNAHRAAISAAASAMITGIERAIEVGRLLAEEQKRHGHGEWIPWIEENLEFGRKQAAKYMRAYSLRGELQKKLSNVPSEETFVRSVDGALKLFAKPRQKSTKRSHDSLPASVEVEDSDDDDDSQPDAGQGEDEDDDSVLGAYLIRADQAARFAFYKGPASNEVIAMARHVADAWTKLADRLENKK